MREILFRGKTTNKKEWLYGNLVDKNYIIGNMVEFEENYFDTEFWYRVNPKTVGQYTGLHDRNGVKIFEGDIIATLGNAYVFCVAFGKCGGTHNVKNYGYQGFYCKPCNRETKQSELYGLRLDIYYWVNEHGVEIVGNIHDNPELLIAGYEND